MNWYVLTVTTGKELDFKRSLIAKNIQAAVPVETVRLRRGGKWHDEERLYIPSYVFINCNWTPELFHQIKSMGYTCRILPDPLSPKPLSDHEIEFWQELLQDDPLPISEIVKTGETIQVISGPLKGMEGRIEKFNIRQRRVIVSIPMLGGERLATMSISLIQKSECQDRVDSSPGAADEDISDSNLETVGFGMAKQYPAVPCALV